ncbi:glutathione S-transferase family protein [Pseudoalteromonas ruthenica]|uniref:Glutathionyl-hydroquinone reductase YqjG n=1 Tax=Pseudoalteromonas ruthenica TaxID=151081 RepID=A0A0F4PTJ5_9GAMM|nr:glutathione S-transferase family protein [Pseudoalteromonas ruthenica]KJY95076.1 glutathionyl-hydroquinone reductase YqjG [Pseudoalteromonas ruthenica]KJY98757.1 glutathionyl-hydroquinone reductase YqjG [Pseudoalteromonas ruthenica]TMO87050.1 glutathione S-transferase family protein [Pseudoalteromonas ruthenica]TMO93688.1 glutathione S-transferase family protein [Pseudoalteromonas ruthenica]TMO97608.1 glutathione S-transferase family protein [Pseudoalteromonas ruthenica]
MGLLVNGKWQDKWYDTDSSKGEFQRESAQLRNWVTADGSAGPSGREGFKAQKGRYHLYVSLACPWAHRTLIFRTLKGLEDYIDVSVVSPDMLSQGWTFDQAKGSSGDSLFGYHYMHQLYTRNNPTYSGRVTVPVLWDKQQNCIVSNESAEIIRMFNEAFNHLTGNTLDFYPEHLRKDIDAINELVYHGINNGVYRTGFATTQQAYEQAFDTLFSALEKVERRLAGQRYLVGSELTEADWRLFTTLIRFDAVYFGHFKCNKRTIESYDNLANYLRDLYQVKGVAETLNMAHIKRHYYFSHTMINPTQVVPKGPALDFSRPHNRRFMG